MLKSELWLMAKSDLSDKVQFSELQNVPVDQ